MSMDAEALAEVDTIISMMPEEDSIRIPNGFKNFIKTRKSKEYIPNISKEIPLYQQNLKQDTKTLCSLIYRSYLCSKDKKVELENQDKEILIQKEQELREKYNPDNIFKNKSQTVINTVEEHTELMEYKEPIFRRILNKIKSLFHKL